MNDDLFAAAEVIGIVAFAVSGGYAAVRAGMDWLGVVVLAVVVAVGGGTLRDLMLGIEPVWWVSAPGMLVVAAATSLVVIAVAARHPQSKVDSWRIVLYADAVGLAAFTVTGASIALAEGVRPWVAVVFGVITGTGGGVIRDVLVRRKPQVLVGEIYALASIAGAALYVILRETTVPDGAAGLSAGALVLVIRAGAMRWHWHLPRFPEPHA
ncbi:trimeric intracellular cation channel family protein [Aeromicrobium choanae]|uniref:Uncharacterized membrane protein YeiH n=1 Tax=Aeromicrobium choanae TaxID=1736691 RepID=A0A1T4Z503_9ACTN|nr:TRIC cation channel family protein [Aeromicrobium choanae]SKB09142.1 Uncharacterized membrane protein YeiH [Aeromicrobium choanae]